MFRSLSLFLFPLIFFGQTLPAQIAPPDAGGGDLRVRVVLNGDGSRTSYETDEVKRVSVATTTTADGKFREKIRYQLDSAGRFTQGECFGPKDQFRFRALYKYDANGRLSEEARQNKDGSSLGRIAFEYDNAGHQLGYTVYDANGNLVGRTAPQAKTARPR